MRPGSPRFYKTFARSASASDETTWKGGTDSSYTGVPRHLNVVFNLLHGKLDRQVDPLKRSPYNQILSQR